MNKIVRPVLAALSANGLKGRSKHQWVTDTALFCSLKNLCRIPPVALQV